MGAPERLTKELEMLRALLARTAELRGLSIDTRERAAESLAQTQARIARCKDRIEQAGLSREEIERRIRRWENSQFAPDVAPRFDVVAFVTSAGGMEAISAILRHLPRDFGAAVVVAQHLSGAGSTLVGILSRRTQLPIVWMRPAQKLERGVVHVCPPRKQTEIHPDGTCVLHDGAPVHKMLDALLESIADSYGSRAIGVVLTGMGSDGSKGAAALKRAGGTVIVQSEETAEQPGMPRAAIKNGAADLVLPLQDIGPVVADIMLGAPLPRPTDEIEAAQALFSGPGEMRALMRALDWSATPPGRLTSWPAALRIMVRTTLDSSYPMAVWWGAGLIQIYNDEWRKFLGSAKHPAALAGRAKETWPEIWPMVGPIVERVIEHGEAVGREDYGLFIARHGEAEEIFATFSYSPIRDEQGAVVGVHNIALETTERVVAERRMRTLRALAAQVSGTVSSREACEVAATALVSNPADIPFALFYLVDEGRRQATLSGIAGLEPGSFAAPQFIEFMRAVPTSAWPIERALGKDAGVLIEDLGERFRGLPAPAPDLLPPRAALLVPLHATAGEAPVGVVVFGLSTHRPFDEGYRSFLDLVARQIEAGLSEARGRRLERERLEQLAELDRSKTEFFSNVSHEFRTPLTLLLGPLDELQRRHTELPRGLGAEVGVAASNARRLLNLVNTLLDFSLAEAGRLRAEFEPVDLAALTVDIASVFRNAAERAGLELSIDAPPLPERVWVDRDMWEKIVSNLLSNALKFTLQGKIGIELRALQKHAELVVRDTGVGIPTAELPHIFKRFHRVRSTRARTYEGAGIGLALVHELIRRHHGRARVHSTEGVGTAFTVWMPLGPRAQDDAVPRRRAADKVASVASTLAEEAARWSPEPSLPAEVVSDTLGPARQPVIGTAHARILVVDDNADMRGYLRRLLSPNWRIDTAADGEEALARVRELKPDLVLADVMMPKLDGFGLLRAIRSDASLQATPVVLITARAGEEAAIEGLLAGADDYVAKPFSARELIARVGGQLELARVRRRTAELNAFLVRFSDAVRALVDPRAVARTALRMLTEHFDAEEAYWAVVDGTTREYLIEDTYRVDGDAGTPPSLARFRLDACEPWTSSYRAGRSIIIDDVRADERLPDALKVQLAAARMRAHIGVPVTVDGRLRAALGINQSSPRHWTLEDAAFVENVAGRCWAEIERAGAAGALRENEQRLRAFAHAGTFVVYRMSADWSEMRQLDGRGFLGDAPDARRDWLTQYIHPDDQPHVLGAIQAAIREKRVFELEHRVRRADGTLGWTLSRAVPLLDAAGRITEWIGAASDITERKRRGPTRLPEPTRRGPRAADVRQRR